MLFESESALSNNNNNNDLYAQANDWKTKHKRRVTLAMEGRRYSGPGALKGKSRRDNKSTNNGKSCLELCIAYFKTPKWQTIESPVSHLP